MCYRIHVCATFCLVSAYECCVCACVRQRFLLFKCAQHKYTLNGWRKVYLAAKCLVHGLGIVQNVFFLIKHRHLSLSLYLSCPLSGSLSLHSGCDVAAIRSFLSLSLPCSSVPFSMSFDVPKQPIDLVRCSVYSPCALCTLFSYHGPVSIGN